ncbi:MAG: UDP-glucose 4-epimerase GalE [Bacteroidia bacterium]
MQQPTQVLVTGGAGFIGSHTVVELHEAGYAPVIVDNLANSHRGILKRVNSLCGKEIPAHELDCRDADAMRWVFRKHGQFLAVIHFAAFKAVGESVEHPAMYFDNNIGSLSRLLEAMPVEGRPGLVFSSSCTVYGQPKVLPVTESSPIQPASSPYGYTKQVCEQLIHDAVVSPAGLKSVILRYFNPIGAHPSGLIGELPIGAPNNLVPYITQSAAGLRPPLRVFGSDYNTPDGTAIRDFIHVVDLAKAHVKALDILKRRPEKSFAHIANVGTGTGSSVLEAIHAFQKATGMPLSYELTDRRAGDVEAVWAAVDESKLAGWRAERGLEECMRDAWNWQMSLANNPL